jgi:hypothetical protein
VVVERSQLVTVMVMDMADLGAGVRGMAARGTDPVVRGVDTVTGIITIVFRSGSIRTGIPGGGTMVTVIHTMITVTPTMRAIMTTTIIRTMPTIVQVRLLVTAPKYWCKTRSPGVAITEVRLMA